MELGEGRRHSGGIKRVGEVTSPCGTPFLVGTVWLTLLLSLILVIQWLGKLFIQLCRAIPADSKFKGRLQDFVEALGQVDEGDN